MLCCFFRNGQGGTGHKLNPACFTCGRDLLNSGRKERHERAAWRNWGMTPRRAVSSQNGILRTEHRSGSPISE